MARKYNNENKETVIKYINKLIANLESIINNYSQIYTKEELSLILSSKISLEKIHQDILLSVNLTDYLETINGVFDLENSLKDLIYKAWLYEESKGYSFISWLKDDKYVDGKEIIYSTFSCDFENNFCDSIIGIKYKVEPDGFIGASEIDGATIILNSDEECIYTIGSVNGCSINSYNFATKIPSPKLIMDSSMNKYQSKHNEIILNGKYIKPIEIICLSSIGKEIAEELSVKLNVPVSYLEKSNKM